MKERNKGFTIVELVIVIAVIAILAAVLIPTFGKIIQNANNSKALSELKQIQMHVQIETLPDNYWSFKDKNNASNEIEINRNEDGRLWVKNASDLADAFNSCPDFDKYGSFAVSGENIVYTTENGKGTAVWNNIIGTEPAAPAPIYSEGLKYTLSNDGETYKVTGIGSCTDTNILIPPTHEGKPVVAIYAFNQCKEITSVVIPEGVTIIGGSVFEDCTNLKSITLPSTLTSIGSRAFYGCTNLSGIVIPEGVTSVEDSTFSGCSSLESITLPSTLTSIGTYAFNGCTNLSGNIVIPEGVTSIEYATFSGCSSLESITLPRTLTSIGEFAFRNCTNLSGDIIIPEGVTSIEKNAFTDCASLTSISLPSTLTTIGSQAFYSCSSVTSITYGGSVEQWNEISLGESWRAYVPCKTVICSDGEVKFN